MFNSVYIQHVCVSVCFLFPGRVKSKEAGDRRREKVDRVEKQEKKKKEPVRDERSGEEGCFILYCEGLLLINVSWSVSVGAE